MSNSTQKVIAAILSGQHGMQVRGSIPLYWNQEGVTHLKPDITLQHYDPLYTATRLHFEVPLLVLLTHLTAVAAGNWLVVSIPLVLQSTVRVVSGQCQQTFTNSELYQLLVTKYHMLYCKPDIQSHVAENDRVDTLLLRQVRDKSASCC